MHDRAHGGVVSSLTPHLSLSEKRRVSLRDALPCIPLSHEIKGSLIVAAPSHGAFFLPGRKRRSDERGVIRQGAGGVELRLRLTRPTAQPGPVPLTRVIEGVGGAQVSQAGRSASRHPTGRGPVVGGQSVHEDLGQVTGSIPRNFFLNIRLMAAKMMGLSSEILLCAATLPRKDASRPFS